MQFRSLFWHISYYKVLQSNFITKWERLLLQSESRITKCDSYYKVRLNTGIILKNLTLIIFFTSKETLSTRNLLKHTWNTDFKYLPSTGSLQ